MRSARSWGAGAGKERRAAPAASCSAPCLSARSAPPHAATSLSAIGCKGGAETGGLQRGEEAAGARQRNGFLPEPVTQVHFSAVCICLASGFGRDEKWDLWPGSCSLHAPRRAGATPGTELGSERRTERIVFYTGCHCVSVFLEGFPDIRWSPWLFSSSLSLITNFLLGVSVLVGYSVQIERSVSAALLHGT